METTMSLALLGQPNSGKSTLFNGLTGSHQRVGNWPGKTVEKKLGTCTRGGTTYTICDLPGAYSLSAMSEEEQVTQAYIADGEADVVCVMVDASQLAGLVMELPPYHKPKFKPLFFMALRRYKHIAWRAFKVILVVALVFWLLTYSATGVIDDSFIGTIGTAIDPVTRFFGMGWRTFAAFLGALMAKEAMLGVLAALFASADPSMMAAASGSAAAGFSVATLATQIPGPEALAFLFACTFNVPCVMTLGTTYSETHSLKWTVLIALFYFAMALCISFVVFHVASLFM